MGRSYVYLFVRLFACPLVLHHPLSFLKPEGQVTLPESQSARAEGHPARLDGQSTKLESQLAGPEDQPCGWKEKFPILQNFSSISIRAAARFSPMKIKICK